jgi:DNA-binding winged helix-turn-helix (wHTH) protein/TolB-like protein
MFDQRASGARAMTMEQETAVETGRPFRVGDWLVNPALDEISHVDLVLKLEPRMVRLLARLAASPGEVVSTRQLLDDVWSDVVVGPASVYQAVSQLRKLLGDTGTSPTYIATIPKKGYRLIAAVRPLDPDAQPANAAPPEPPAPSHRRPERRTAWIAAASIALLGVVAALALRKQPATEAKLASAPAEIVASDSNSHTLAVLPFQSGADEPSVDAALSFTQLMRERLAESPDSRVIAVYSSTRAAELRPDLAAIGQRLRARYLVGGEAERLADSFRLRVWIFDALPGKEIWSKSRDAPLMQMAEANESLAQQVAQRIRATLPAGRKLRPVDPYAYPLYAKAQGLLPLVTYPDNQRAQELLARSVALDPSFARGHLALAQALTQAARMRDSRSHAAPPAAAEAVRRALELEPDLGAAYAERALWAWADPAQTEQLLLRGLQLAPNEVFGYWAYSEFLKEHQRTDEALRMLDRARAIDPLLPGLNIIKKEMVQDQGEYEHLLRETVKIEPDNVIALVELSDRKFMAGNVAESLVLAERAAKASPEFDAPRFMVARSYLALGMLEAAREASVGAMWAPFLQMQIHVFDRDLDAAMKLATANVDEPALWELESPNFSDAVRDYGLANRRLPEAVAVLQSRFQKVRDRPVIERMSVGLNLAHVLMLSGEKERGLALVREILAVIDEQKDTANLPWLAGRRTAALLLMGSADSALLELAVGEKAGVHMNWWYLAERSPLYSAIRENPKFIAMVDRANRHRDGQRKLIEQSIRKGEIPRRPKD